ncbi:hypothetical protein F5Y18DRAFT_399462 [Xylariaceae sp. FL1019]|nr:hypothetical protein F5Y18DRAFT_399462 [Xylariaceae sp. FL1019]
MMADQALGTGGAPVAAAASLPLNAAPSSGDAMDVDATHNHTSQPQPASDARLPHNAARPNPDQDAHQDADTDDRDGDADAYLDVDADADGEPEESSQVPGRLDNNMLNVIENVANYLTAYKDAGGYHIATHFQRIPNRRLIPDYHEVIKEPTAFSTIRTKKLKKQYAAFAEFVRDVALISHNAQVYNRSSSQVFKDAVRLRDVFQEELQKLVDDDTITAAEALLPDLGEIPEAEDDSPDDQEGEDVEEEDEEDDDDDEDDDSSDSDDSRRRGRRRRRGARKSDSRDTALQTRRGRPPKVFTPVEARIHSLLKGLRKLKRIDGDLLVYAFERLPDKASNPDYYTTIANPMALNIIKRKCKSKKYQNVDQAMQDINLMFNNAKEYNIESSQIYQDAEQLQAYAQDLAEQEKGKPDNDFEDEEGRRPIPEIPHNGEIWRVGDWVHITNANDLTKPIPAQIYRTWQDRQGQNWVNACWYYRPEQTVHRFERHFFENEVVKTGQYRDHRIDEVVDRCFVMFVTRYDKGRPRGLAKDKDVYICKSRYNEENHKLNKIKTWSSCLPDEVRDKDYEMDLFDVPRGLKKIPSPIKHLLRYDAKPTDPLPKPTWGAPNAPPLVGAVHCREREPNESPPPEPMSSLGQVHVDPIRRPSMMQTPRPVDGQGDVNMSNTGHFSPMPPQASPASSHATPSYAPPYAPPRPNATPVPVPQYGAHTYQGGHAAASTHLNQMPPQPAPHYQAQAPQLLHQPHHTPAPAYNGYSAHYNTTPGPMPHQPHHAPHQSGNPVVGYDPSQRLVPSPARMSTGPAPAPAPSPGSSYTQGNAYHPPRPVEVYRLDDATDASIPRDIRNQFLRDEAGRVLFFTQPPLDRPHRGITQESANLGHSVRYLADRAREREDRRAKRKAREESHQGDESKRMALEREAAQEAKRAQIDDAAKKLLGWSQSIQDEADSLMVKYSGWSVRGGDLSKT